MNVTNKVVVVTGASYGIGKALKDIKRILLYELIKDVSLSRVNPATDTPPYVNWCMVILTGNERIGAVVFGAEKSAYSTLTKIWMPEVL